MKKYDKRCCGACKWFREKKPTDRESAMDKKYSHWCAIQLMGTEAELLRCGGDDYWEEPARIVT